MLEKAVKDVGVMFSEVPACTHTQRVHPQIQSESGIGGIRRSRGGQW